MDAEVDTFVGRYPCQVDSSGKRPTVPSGNIPGRESINSKSSVEVTQGRVRDITPDPKRCI